jgi:type IV pilus assembly protein PilV
MNRSSNLRKREHGFSLVEILVTLIITAIGLLGIAATQATMQQADFESYERAQALVLANDMLDRISANRYAAPCYAFTDGNGRYLGTESGGGHLGAPNCALGSATAEQVARANADLTEWDQILKGVSEARNGLNIGAMTDARGCVRFDAPTATYTVIVSWQGRAQTFSPVVGCANGLYGPETQRRSIWVTLRIANLL